jgi:hypothetical protein
MSQPKTSQIQNVPIHEVPTVNVPNGLRIQGIWDIFRIRTFWIWDVLIVGTCEVGTFLVLRGFEAWDVLRWRCFEVGTFLVGTL